MPRVKLDIPESLAFETQMQIRVSDLNYANHLSNDRVLTFMNEARVRYLQSLGFTELDAGGCGIIVADAAIQFKAEGFYGQKLRVQVGAGDFGRRGFDLYYRFVLAEPETVLAEAKTGIVCFDYSSRKAVSVPDALKSKLQQKPTVTP